MNGIEKSFCFVIFILFVSIDGGISKPSGRLTGDIYEVGVGIGDVTGLSAGIGLMGYANPAQLAKGIHTRLFARTFIVKSGDDSVVFVSVDAGMIDTSIKRAVIEKLTTEFDTLYTVKNVLLSATHTHSGPGGYIQYAMYGIASLGFHKENFNTIVDGIVESIQKAHYSLQRGYLSINSGELLNANINRSPAAYDANTDANSFPYNVDKEMTLLRIDSEAGEPLGVFTWFPVHPTSMNNTNRLISGDNKGYASMLFEYEENPGQRPGKGNFVAAFASSNLGDVSPNLDEAKCRAGPNAGQPCNYVTSVCGETITQCIAFGPGTNGDMEESTQIIGKRQFDKARELFDAEQTIFRPVSGRVQFALEYVNMSSFEIPFTNSSGLPDARTTCPAAMGYSFAAGTTDGPGLFFFTQGDTSPGENNEFWDLIRNFLQTPSQEQMDCHVPKPILLNVGECHLPYDWVPSIIDTQILRVGNLYLLGIPGELTTMAGRRLVKAVKDRILSLPNPGDPEVIIAGLSNVYTHYITTVEEYQIQRYEGASTIYGPNTLEAYTYQFSQLAEKMITEVAIPDGNLKPPNFMNMQLSLLSPIIVDLAPPGYSMGSTKTEPAQLYIAGDTVVTKFVAGHPRNNAMREGSFFVVERLRDDASWDVVANDADWSTKFKWDRPLPGLDNEVEITWKTETSTPPGVYRIRHFGFYKPYLVDMRQYDGTTRTFEIRSSKGIRQRLEKPKERIETPLVKFWKKLITGFQL